MRHVHCFADHLHDKLSVHFTVPRFTDCKKRDSAKEETNQLIIRLMLADGYTDCRYRQGVFVGTKGGHQVGMLQAVSRNCQVVT
jgi:hypothetical protein